MPEVLHGVSFIDKNKKSDKQGKMNYYIYNIYLIY